MICPYYKVFLKTVNFKTPFLGNLTATTSQRVDELNQIFGYHKPASFWCVTTNAKLKEL